MLAHKIIEIVHDGQPLFLVQESYNGARADFGKCSRCFRRKLPACDPFVDAVGYFCGARPSGDSWFTFAKLTHDEALHEVALAQLNYGE